MDMNMLPAAFTRNRFPLPQKLTHESLLNPSMVPALTAMNLGAGLPGFLPISAPTIKPEVMPHPHAVRTNARHVLPSRTNPSHHHPASLSSTPSPSNWPNEPLDLSVKSEPVSEPVMKKNLDFRNVDANGMTPLDLSKMTQRLPCSRPLADPSLFYKSIEKPLVNQHHVKSQVLLYCTRCPFSCYDTQEFQLHFTSAHNMKPAITDMIIKSVVTPHGVGRETNFPPSTKEPHCLHCSYCGWQCSPSRMDTFNSHIAEHGCDSGNTYVCYYCKSDFHDPNMLREHLAVHPGINHHVCSFCSIAFQSHNMASLHMKNRHGLTYVRPRRDSVDRSLASSSSSIRSGGAGASRRSETRESPTTSSVGSQSPGDSSGGDRLPASPSTSCQSKQPLVMKKTGFGQSLAKHIEAAISRELIGKKTPTVTDLMFMKSSSNEGCPKMSDPPTTADPVSATSGGSEPKKPSGKLNLMSLLDKVVEESLRKVPVGQKPPKPNIKFMVSFSDDEDDEDRKSASPSSKETKDLMSAQTSASQDEVTSSKHDQSGREICNTDISTTAPTLSSSGSDHSLDSAGTGVCGGVKRSLSLCSNKSLSSVEMDSIADPQDYSNSRSKRGSTDSPASLTAVKQLKTDGADVATIVL